MIEESFSDFSNSFRLGNRKLIVQLGIGRSGSLMLQSLFDAHKNIFMYPGILSFYLGIAPRLATEVDWQSLVKGVLDLWWKSSAPYNIYTGLGESGKDSVPCPCDYIMDCLAKEHSDSTPTRRELFLSINYAAALLFDESLEEVSILYTHEHNSQIDAEFFDNIEHDFPKAQFICTVRDPRSNFISMLNWEAKRKSMQTEGLRGNILECCQFEERCWHWYERYLPLLDLHADSMSIVRLEDLQDGKEKFIRELSARLGIGYADSMLHTTCRGFIWAGDNFSERQPGFRSSASQANWRLNLHPLKQVAIEALFADEITALEYPKFYEKAYFWKIVAFMLLPFWNYVDFYEKFSGQYFQAARVARSEGNFMVLARLIREYWRSLSRIVKKLRAPSRIFNRISKSIVRPE